MNQPLVSIIIPVYNGSNFMKKAIGSALCQTYPNIEVIVVNDGSNDAGATEATALSYGDSIRYFSKENGGVSSALNMGISQMRGDYFSWLSHDDEYTPDKIQKQMHALAAYEYDGKLAALCSSRQIDVDSAPVRGGEGSLPFGQDRIVPWDEALLALIRQRCFNGCAFLIPKAMFEECGGFNEELRFSQDMMMWLTMFTHRYNLLAVSEQLVLSRLHGGQLTQTGQDIFHRDSNAIADMILPKLCELSTEQSNFVLAFAHYNAIYNNGAAVQKCIIEGRKRALITTSSLIGLRIGCIYGKVRPLIRQLYHRILKPIR